MSQIHYSNEKVGNIPIPEDGVTFGKISATNMTGYVLPESKIALSGNYVFETITITLRGIKVPPLQKPDKRGFGSSFNFRQRNWLVLDVVEGSKFKIAGTDIFSSWAVTAVDLRSGRVSISG